MGMVDTQSIDIVSEGGMMIVRVWCCAVAEEASAELKGSEGDLGGTSRDDDDDDDDCQPSRS
jgi:hypothetical protein